MNVSVVIPVYNNEEYINRCVESLLNQDTNDFEIIIVDDGSTDESLNICRRFQSDRIKVFSKPNRGPASARNYGIDHCSPESDFVMFVDSDDTVKKAYVSQMLEHASNNHLVVCGMEDIYDTKQLNDIIESSGVANIYEDFWNNLDFLSRLRTGIINSSCNKCYSLQLIRNNNIRFEKKYPEDTRFNLAYLEFCNSIYSIEDKLYNYIHRSGSVTSEPSETIFTEYLNIQNYLLSKVGIGKANDVYEFTYPQYLGVTKRFVQCGDSRTPTKYLNYSLIKDAVRHHHPISKGDALVKYIMLFGFPKLLKFL